MLKNPDAFRRIVTGVALLAWPVLEFLAFLTSPPSSEHDPAVFREHPGLVQVSGLLFLWTALSLIPVILGLAHLLRRRAPLVGNIGAALGLLGAGHALTLFTTDFYDLALAQILPDAQAEAVTARVGELWGFLYGMLLPGFLAHVGLFTLLIGLVVAGVAPWWVPVVALAGTVVPFVTMEQSTAVQSVGSLLHLAAYGWIALRVLRTSDAEWRTGVTAPPPSPA
ncbi:hypothetical protein [Streptosporangium carneum]|uniref:DUF4386 domain-containing protein n=1 Tax=Streptosporangium carneum TaxID=47481 RepID=A0A9W6MBG9_9ACTN|nr:hypothetical protein [Streptosporangium carneum]GLK08319.1 hypothetical protein GCM10017600_17240 [Streptosporangium carneum]